MRWIRAAAPRGKVQTAGAVVVLTAAVVAGGGWVAVTTERSGPRVISADEVAVARQAASDTPDVSIPPTTASWQPQPVPDVGDPERERFETFDVDGDGRPDWARIYEQVVEVRQERGWWAAIGQETSRALLAAVPGIATAVVGSRFAANKARQVIIDERISSSTTR